MKILIAGGGHAATLVARRLIREGNDVVMVEENQERCQELEEMLDAKIIRGNAASIKVLYEAGLSDTEMLIALTSEDQTNVLVCMIASVESNVQFKVARIRTHEVQLWRKIFEGIGLKIDLIIHPETEIADRILRVVHLPGVSDVIDFADGQVKVFGMNINENNWVCNKTVEDLDLAGPPQNSLIALIFRGQQVFVPHGAEVLKSGDHVYIVTTAEQLKDVCKFMGLETQESLNRVFIVGGKQVGIRVAALLENQGVKVKLFEQNVDRCKKIAQILRKTVVLHADGTDESILAEEGIKGAGAFLAMTNDDEDNLIASLLARKLGAKKVVALINRLNYHPMSQRLGINTTVSPRLAAVDRILQFVRKGRVLSVTTFREEEAEAIELIAAKGSKYVGQKLRDIHFPRGAIVGAIARPNGQVLVPRGEATIEAGDRVIFCALESVVPRLESSFLSETRKGSV